MEIEYKQPKLKDKLYGEIFWDDWDEEESFWYAPMKTDSGERFDLLIRADSPTDFMTVGRTHSTYRKTLENLASIRDEMRADILENSRRVFKKKRERDSFGEALKKNLRLFSVKIYSDLSAEVAFAPVVGEDEDPDETFYALLDKEGEMIEAGIEEL
jgi:hypothetical protein